MIETGMFYFSNNKKGLFPKLIRFFTNSKISHCGIITTPILSLPAAQETAEVVQIIPFNRNYSQDNEEFVLFRIKRGFTSAPKINDAVRYCFWEFSGVQYGKFQLLYFVYRYLYQKFFKKLPGANTKNWFTNGIICSELLYWYLVRLGPVFEELLKPYNADTIQAQDLLDIVLQNPDKFEVVQSKGLNL